MARPRQVAQVLRVAALGVLLACVAGPAVAWAGTEPGVAVEADEPSPLEPLEVDDPAVTSGMAWHLDATGARVAWRSSLGASVVVAVIDSGVDASHPDLVGQVASSVDCIGAAGAPDGCRAGGTDESGHGTHVAGIIAARADDRLGVAGVAPRARILAVKALEARCTDEGCTVEGDAGDLAAGVRWAVREEADVINLSVSAPYRLAPDLLDAMAEAWDAGALVVLSAGNRSDVPMFFDTSYALVVTATDRDGGLAPYAPAVDNASIGVAAPGGRGSDTEYTCHDTGEPVGIVSTVPTASGDGSGYDCMAGTSMAAGQVSGGLALLLSMGFNRDEAFDRLVSTARPAEGLGYGLVDLAAAVDRPYPPGVTNRHDSFATGVTPPPVTELPAEGPFSVPSIGDDPPPIWLYMLGGAVGLAVLAELGMRLFVRRQRSVAGASPPTGGPDAPTDPRSADD